MQYKGVEFDVMLSRDEVPILIHDHILDRTVRHPVYSAKEPKIWVSELDGAELCNINVGTWFAEKCIINDKESYADVKIPLFEDVLEYCRSKNLWMNIEIKPVPGFEEITGKIVGEITKKHFPPNGHSVPQQLLPVFSSFSYEALLAAKESAPHISRGYLMKSIHITTDWKERMKSLEAISVHLDYKRLQPDDVKAIREEGYCVMCYTVNDPNIAKSLYDEGVDAICTDELLSMSLFL